MLLHADWVLPVAHPPMREGAVLVRGSRIAAFGLLAELERSHPDEPVTRHEGCVLVPGLVNAHTHLALTALEGVVPSAPFAEWIGSVVPAMRMLDADDLVASAVLGAHRSLTAGVTVVGDIAYGPESPAIAADSGLGGTFFWEVLGIPATSLDEELERAEYPQDPEICTTARTRYGLSPHSTYTSGPALLQAIYERALAEQAGFAIHLAESPAEVELLVDGSGPLAEVAARTADGFDSPETPPVDYLEDLGVLQDALVIHCAELAAADISRLASRCVGVVLCPRSNAYLHVGPAPVHDLDHAGVPLALGTDSLASNTDLDLFAEARALTRIAPGLSAERIIRMMTEDGAAALGLAGSFGTLEPGRQADLAIYQVGPSDRPHEALLETGGRSTVQAVMSSGVWRVLSGRATSPISSLETAVRHAAAKAASACTTPRNGPTRRP